MRRASTSADERHNRNKAEDSAYAELIISACLLFCGWMWFGVAFTAGEPAWWNSAFVGAAIHAGGVAFALHATKTSVVGVPLAGLNGVFALFWLAVGT